MNTGPRLIYNCKIQVTAIFIEFIFNVMIKEKCHVIEVPYMLM